MSVPGFLVVSFLLPPDAFLLSLCSAQPGSDYLALPIIRRLRLDFPIYVPPRSHSVSIPTLVSTGATWR